MSLVASLFSAAYARFWPQLLPDTPLQLTPSFDGRAICYPTVETLQDYLAWRQVDTHVNNQVPALCLEVIADPCCSLGCWHEPRQPSPARQDGSLVAHGRRSCLQCAPGHPLYDTGRGSHLTV